jgi:uncharacterized lipoprotein YehR (DUF1307 family)
MKLLNYLDFINEGLIKTHPYNIVLNKVNFLPNNLIYNINYTQSDNIIHFEILYFNKLSEVSKTFDVIESYFINMMGWFPSMMVIENLSGMENSIQYNRDYLIKNINFLQKVKITFESKFDIESTIPVKLYHLSIKEFEKLILKNGISPKSKSKISYHDSRIYLCKSIMDCQSLIPNMKMFYSQQKWSNPNSKINDKWLIYEIDTNDVEMKLYYDPNYIGGYYTLSNISPTKIKIVKTE